MLFVISGIKAYRKEYDPDDPPPKWMTMIESITPLKAFLISAAWALVSPKLWVFTMAAINTVTEADLTNTEGIIAYLIYMLGCVALMLALLTYYLPGSAAAG